MNELLRLDGIMKAFPGVKALQDVQFDVRKGEVVSLMGENGAGKSTLIKILAGVYRKDAGTIQFDGQRVEIESPLHSQSLGISVMFQELNLLPNLSVAENIFAGREKGKFGLFDKLGTKKEALRYMNEVGLNCPPHTLVRELSVSQRQMVEFAKALSIQSRLIILDEPTSSLTDREAEKLFEIVKKLKRDGVSIVFVSHKLKEVQMISDRVHILRDGAYVGCLEKGEITEDKIIQLMVGRTLENIFEKTPTEIGDEVLEVKGLHVPGKLKNISFSVRKGEIVGFAGLVGAGRTEVMRAVMGVDKRSSGQIFIEGEEVQITSPSQAIQHGIGLVPEDRKQHGLILGLSVKKNISLSALKQLTRAGILSRSAEDQLANEYIDKLRIKTPHKDQRAGNLSGGNQQKIVISKWLATHPRVLILDEPTRGIDVGAKKEIYTLMSQLAQQGVAIIMISSEMPEILGMSDRIIVMHEGEIKGTLDRESATQEKILELALKGA
ncbi:sugar ABC transporter ATP-binding protein [Paenibacillus sp. GCM10012307]|uniref:Sugar ABC transporter ATP-binding protein n=1 Tax=Paenibacillus roseus TaxID=2798579 RepID=A0A934J770_9BACL|nr:sugar ABC transporter ATP-binding protein [Paenibacillus roseus]MBJ6361642.1 sugar ABC transporter ATP-binding protein [Paenibacillus roseus]